MGRPFSVAVVAGEPSGDGHAGKLVEAFDRLAPGSRWFGAGGPAMASAGVEIAVPMERLAVVGIAEVVAHLPSLWRSMGTLKRMLRQRRPDALVLVDFPDFNFRLARFAHQLGLPVLYYITPQVWAWRQGRTEFLRRNVDLCLVIFPFEEPFLAARGVGARFVGHPFVGTVATDSSLQAFLDRQGLGPERRRVALLPGSRASEVQRNLPPLMDAARRLLATRPDVCVLVPWAKGLPDALRRPYRDLDVRWVEGEYRDVLGHAHAAAVASGTATLEGALLGVPEVIVYRLKRASYAIGSRLVKLENVGLPNIVLGERAIPELIQSDFTGQRVADVLGGFLDEPEVSRTRAEVMSREIRARLGEGNGYQRAASEIMAFLEAPERRGGRAAG